jgi:uncharacterized membrane protein SirB2
VLKFLHLFLVGLVFFSFISRVILAETNPARLHTKWLKITPHVVDTLLLLSGFGLVLQGQWLSGNYNWLITKLLILLAYITFGMIAMRMRKFRFLTTAAAISCLFLIINIAYSKKIFVFF